MTYHDADTDELIRRAAAGDDSAKQQLLIRHRGRLRQMVSVRMDPRLTGRLDPSDVVQDVLLTASQRLPEYLKRLPVAFYPWLREIAWNRMIDLYRQNIQARQRSVTREDAPAMALSEGSVIELANRLASSGTSPSGRLVVDEQRRRVQLALGLLRDTDREVLVMRHLEDLSTAEIADVLGITEAAVKKRQLRALQRLRALLEDESGE